MDDIEITFGNEIVRLDATVLEVFQLRGMQAGTRIPVNFLGVTVRETRHGDLEIGLGWRKEPFDGHSTDVLDDDAAVLSPVALLTLDATQWPRLQPLLVEAERRRTVPDA